MNQGRKAAGTVAAALLTASLLLSACGSNGGNEGNASSTGNTSGESNAASSNQPAEKQKITFYGKIVEYTSGEPMVAELQKQLQDKFEIEPIQVDWGNLEKVIKTGIASGSPADVYTYWPGAMKTFVDANQALDLTPYLEANGGEWKNTFNQTLLDMGKFNGKYYNVPLDSNFSVVYVNKDLFDKAGVAVPSNWSWDEFLTASQAIKDKTGVFPFGISKDLQSWLFRNGMLSLGKDAGKLEDLSAGNVPATDPILVKPLQNIKDLYDKDLWYPHQGAVTISRDEVKSAFYQGKVAMLAEVSANAKDIITNSKTFTAVAVEWPHMGQGNVFLGGADGLFIPANAPNKDAAVEVLKAYLGEAVQKINADMGYATANAKLEITDPLIKSIAAMATNIYPGELINLSPKITDYINNQIIPDYVLGGQSEQQVLGKMDELRKEAIAK
ncbi:ABC transporter substrate-binding protein [Paenibacillus sp. BC26]|uniref:ABC transporter substrate-binding protein n=1 Tax=Paenibacillus sp. BC26 TaxID=1881032 RepID=UPI0008ED3E82|nr:extracellular solute-binding protein [Paenibacillus sp. BC26]SFT06642.1 ABC-type glycerol-3-phosphate transport system, substrate-binding protein [Paenibacillus sp. BC26]